MRQSNVEGTYSWAMTSSDLDSSRLASLRNFSWSRTRTTPWEKALSGCLSTQGSVNSDRA